jgi:2-polyprenyl-3-methyl-5-hydroxy-6-metoxy-1,4-benzoquinol methylase
MQFQAEAWPNSQRDRHYHEAVKYIKKFDSYAEEKLRLFRSMGLEQAGTKKILDIGSGLGVFPWICRLHNHHCTLTDVSPHQIWRKAHRLLQINRNYRDLEIVAYQDIELTQQYDIITAHRTVFDEHDYRWHAEEWTWFLKQLAPFLTDTGFVFIKTNLTEYIPQRPHPKIRQLFAPYLVEGHKALTFKMTKQQIEELE